MFLKSPRLSLFLLLSLLLAACSPSPDTASTEGEPRLTPYHTVTPTQPAPSATPLPPDAPTVAPPTPTPFIYTVNTGDTMLAIALNFGITLDELLTANPGVDPRFLSVGTALTIPTAGQGPAASLPSPTPVAVSLAEPYCWPTADDGLWCFLPVSNPGAAGLENLEARLTLVNAQGEPLASAIATTLLNLLPAGQSLPLAVLFEPPAPEYAGVRAELLAALPVDPSGGRYLYATLADPAVRIADNGLSAALVGRISLPDTSPSATRVWVAAVALDAEGRVVGIRRWENEAPLEGGGSLGFSFNVYSLSGPIVEVLLLVEARP
ncbi:MAG: LysM domain-containing protein [Anaerolineae bacterium]|nr:MAG: LysM domain-containing protein [Anaerolineae bacterium]